ncbi:MAG: NAD-dependent epimerase/dehydratase family protein [Anaerolineae bacterium]|nr:NAD-dependent epimerase/dehydratase family protein [Anaerolineae bacterium]
MSAQPDSELQVIFGTGPMGVAIANVLISKGKRIRLVNRSGKLPLGLQSAQGVEVVKANASVVAESEEVTKGASIVYQCAQPPYHQWQGNFPALQAAIVEGAAANNARLVVTENLYMYGDVSDAQMREDLPLNPHTKKGKVRAEMTQALMAAHQTGKLRVVIGRGSDFFGPNDPVSGSLTYVPALAGKKVSGLGNIDMPHTYTFTKDFANALVILGEHEDAYGQAWHVPNAPTVTTRQYLQLVFEAAGTTARIGAVNRLMLQVAGLFSPTIRETTEMLYEFEKPFIVDHSKFVNRFGDISTPLRDAVQQTVAWFRQNPEFAH